MRLFNQRLEFPKIRHFSICFNEGNTVLLENIFLVKIYKKRGAFQQILNLLFGKKYVLVIFLKDKKQLEFPFDKQRLNEAIELKNDIVKKKLTITA